ncbi:hypothetical protein PVK06_034604 [Gossypium arboreum]|uniref:Uncharacterized protein n=1 Tax=Gossypium arboreum TaxID=29729 RepID=A0ABR0NHN8_GOSAR|nr:hypothetical protein PVK06_034604 [Gossypium arboreum]
MDLDSMMDILRGSGETVAPRIRASINGHKRPQEEEKSQSTEGSSGGRLIHHRRRKEPTKIG